MAKKMELPEKELPLGYAKQYGSNFRVGCVSLFFFFLIISLYFKSGFCFTFNFFHNLPGH